jgi:hypothetical protein
MPTVGEFHRCLQLYSAGRRVPSCYSVRRRSVTGAAAGTARRGDWIGIASLQAVPGRFQRVRLAPSMMTKPRRSAPLGSRINSIRQIRPDVQVMIHCVPQI